jgi:hypothetical protein
MSRIHEALKKAEQERAASQGGPSQPDYPPRLRDHCGGGVTHDAGG